MLKYWLIVGWFMVRDYFDIFAISLIWFVVCVLGVWALGNKA